MIEIILTAMENRINLIIVIAIFILAMLDLFLKKDLKSQIVSLGVLGTFLGIFMGLQNFNPDDMKNSIDTILVGLKTAFFTSIVGMGTALILAIIQKLSKKESKQVGTEEILAEISQKLNALPTLDNSNNTNEIIGELERLRAIQTDTRDEAKRVPFMLNELKETATRENRELIYILDTNFKQMNHSLELAIEQLSKGATEEIINALKQVIQEFNQELQTQFGENFVQLNESVINLLQWQENYKNHIEELEGRLHLSVSSIEQSKESLSVISSKNDEVFRVYQELEGIITTYSGQVERLNQDLETYALLSGNAKKMFSTIEDTVLMTKKEFTSLSATIKEESLKQIEFSKNTLGKIALDFEKNKKELDLISNYFRNMGEQIPKALEISLEQLNRGLTSITTQFQKDYQEILNTHKREMR